MRIEWDSSKGHLQGFRKSQEFRSFYAAVAPFVARIREMRQEGSAQMAETTAQSQVLTAKRWMEDEAAEALVAAVYALEENE